jgi:hypothetical protein
MKPRVDIGSLCDVNMNHFQFDRVYRPGLTVEPRYNWRPFVYVVACVALLVAFVASAT